MTYNVIITEKSQEQLDNIISYCVNVLRNKQAAKSILSDVEQAYCRLEQFANVFPLCQDEYLNFKEYRKINLLKHDYVIIYKIVDKNVIILGIFHMLEDYYHKL